MASVVWTTCFSLPADFIYVTGVGTAVGGRHVLEEEDPEEPTHQGIAPQVIAECFPLLRNSGCTLLVKMRIGFTP